MSRYGMKAGGEDVVSVRNPVKALDLIRAIVQQAFGENWTQNEPRCPLCDEQLKDVERHQNRPVGECVAEKCQSTIYPADYMGKIKDVLDDWDTEKDHWIEDMEKATRKAKKAKKWTGGAHKNLGVGSQNPHKRPAHKVPNSAELVDIDEDEVYIW